MRVVTGDPVRRVSFGVPTTETGSEKTTWIGIVSPTLYVPFEVEDVTCRTVGDVVSITMALFAPSEPAPPGVGNVSVALFAAVSRMLPPFRASDAVDVASRSLEFSPEATVYEKVSVVPPDPEA